MTTQSIVNRLMEFSDPLAVTYNSEIVFLVAAHYERLHGPIQAVQDMRRSAQLILRCGDNSAVQRWALMRKRTPPLKRLAKAPTPPASFVKDFLESEKQRARDDFEGAMELYLKQDSVTRFKRV